MVTLSYLRRYLSFLADLLDRRGDTPLPVSNEVVAWFEEVAEILEREHDRLTDGSLDARDRFRVMADLGQAFSYYRQRVYTSGFSGKKRLSTEWVGSVFRRTLDVCGPLHRPEPAPRRPVPHLQPAGHGQRPRERRGAPPARHAGRARWRAAQFGTHRAGAGAGSAARHVRQPPCIARTRTASCCIPSGSCPASWKRTSSRPSTWKAFPCW